MYIKISISLLILPSYADGWYLFWYQWIEKTHSYTLVANIRVYDVYYRKSMVGVATTPPPPSEDVLQNGSGGQGLSTALVYYRVCWHIIMLRVKGTSNI